jgi:hypothetical protein
MLTFSMEMYEEFTFYTFIKEVKTFDLPHPPPVQEEVIVLSESAVTADSDN